MATIASLIVKISADATKLKAGLSKATSKIKAFAKSAAKTLAKIGGAIAVGAVAGVTAIVALVNKYAREIDKLAKTSSKLNIPVKALQKLQYQAELTGVSTDTLNMAMQRMVRRVSEAAQGTGAAKDAIAELGISAEKLNQMSPDQQFYAISKAMKEVGNQGDKVRLAMKIFDTEGVSLVNTMNGNLQAMGDEFDTLGISITGSAAKMVEAYNDSKTKLGAIFSGFGLQLTSQLAAPFTKLIEWISTAIIEMGGMDKVAAKFANAFISGIASAIEAGGQLFNFFRDIKVNLLEIKLFAQQAAKSITFVNLGESIGKVFDKDFKIDLFGDTSKTHAEIKALEESIKNTTGYAEKATKFADELRGTIGKTAGDDGGIAKALKSTDALTTSSNAAAEGLAKVAEAATAQATVANQSRPALGYESNALAEGNIGSIQDYINSMPAGKVLQEMRQRGDFAGVNAQKAIDGKPKTAITLNMVTDAGEVTGELMASQTFIDGMNRLQNDKMSKTARMAAV